VHSIEPLMLWNEREAAGDAFANIVSHAIHVARTRLTNKRCRVTREFGKRCHGIAFTAQ
jgi:hypothetical protein